MQIDLQRMMPEIPSSRPPAAGGTGDVSTAVPAVKSVDEAPPAAPKQPLSSEALFAEAMAGRPKKLEFRPLELPEIPPSKIRRGDYVVHRSLGVGLFEGVFELNEFTIKPDGERGPRVKALKVKYRDRTLDISPKEAKESLKLFRRREEVDEARAPVKLDSTSSRKNWQKRREKAAKKVWDYAADLVKLYAERQQITRPPCEPDGESMVAFDRAFAYAPTPDQERAFREIEEDMVDKEQPMDRLLCGDVGFGKTEVAMRAIYRAVCNGRQVGLLAPTTVLAAQHLRVVRERLPDSRVELLSAIVKRKPKERAALLEDIARGDVDVIVGTHALLSPSVHFADLGLLIVDEEHRFGVRQKDKVKEATTNVDVLSLSATPIPRTMWMCMAGIRAMSTLKTPPAGRLPVNTCVTLRDDDVGVQAIKAELARGGQVFYVVPRVEMISHEIEMLSVALPGVRINYAYGGLSDLEQRIVDFTLREYDVLVATTILENGIDMPNVNTIIVQNTQLFGLSQLHQLRGRVGRAALQAYAYLMHPPDEEISDDARQRLAVVQNETELGAGFALARSDLAMRGSGNVFGEKQKGSSPTKDMGVDLYVEVLQKAMRYLEKKERLGWKDDPEAENELLRQSVEESMLLTMDDSLDVK
jgi:transcription-repair coupling factor (superfamily II helicase)